MSLRSQFRVLTRVAAEKRDLIPKRDSVPMTSQCGAFQRVLLLMMAVVHIKVSKRCRYGMDAACTFALWFAYSKRNRCSWYRCGSFLSFERRSNKHSLTMRRNFFFALSSHSRSEIRRTGGKKAKYLQGFYEPGSNLPHLFYRWLKISQTCRFLSGRAPISCIYIPAFCFCI